MNLRDFFTTNTWWGKIIGAFLGYKLGGAVGAVLGILIGNLFDRAMTKVYSNPHWQYHAEKQKNVQDEFFKATFSIMGYIAKADGRVTEQEIEMARLLMNEMRLNHQQKILAKQLFNEGKLSDFKPEPALTLLKHSCRNNKDLLKVFIDIQYKAAQVDGLTPGKIKALDIIFTQLGFAPLSQQFRFFEEFNFSDQPQSNNNRSSSHQKQHHRAPPQSSLSHAYALLEIAPSASKQEVKRAYRRLISRNHPDKLISQGLPQEMIKIANDKTQKIVKAYEMICESKGW